MWLWRGVLFSEIYSFSSSLYDIWILVVYGVFFWGNFLVLEMCNNGFEMRMCDFGGGVLFSEIYSFESSLYNFLLCQKLLSNNLLVPIFTTRWGGEPKVMGTIESSSLRCFFWHLAKSNWTNSYGDINCWENSRVAAAAWVQ